MFGLGEAGRKIWKEIPSRQSEEDSLTQSLRGTQNSSRGRLTRAVLWAGSRGGKESLVQEAWNTQLRESDIHALENREIVKVLGLSGGIINHQVREDTRVSVSWGEGYCTLKAAAPVQVRSSDNLQ